MKYSSENNMGAYFKVFLVGLSLSSSNVHYPDHLRSFVVEFVAYSGARRLKCLFVFFFFLFLFVDSPAVVGQVCRLLFRLKHFGL